jgi:ABC-type polar amino acid transport system ATPase subunit
MIQVENLPKYYGDLAVIQDVSFNVDKGGVNYSG